MARIYIPYDARYRHRMAELAARVGRQNVPAENPTIRPERLREIAHARRTDAGLRARHLRRRGDIEDAHARWVRLEITRLLEEAGHAAA